MWLSAYFAGLISDDKYTRSKYFRQRRVQNKRVWQSLRKEKRHRLYCGAVTERQIQSDVTVEARVWTQSTNIRLTHKHKHIMFLWWGESFASLKMKKEKNNVFIGHPEHTDEFPDFKTQNGLTCTTAFNRGNLPTASFSCLSGKWKLLHFSLLGNNHFFSKLTGQPCWSGRHQDDFLESASNQFWRPFRLAFSITLYKHSYVKWSGLVSKCKLVWMCVSEERKQQRKKITFHVSIFQL